MTVRGAAADAEGHGKLSEQFDQAGALQEGYHEQALSALGTLADAAEG